MLDYAYSSASSGLGYRLSTAAGSVLEQCGASQWSGSCQPTAGGTFQFSRPAYDLPVPISTTLLRVSFGCLAVDGSWGRCSDPRGTAGLGMRRLALRVADDAALAEPSVVNQLTSPGTFRKRKD